jgi:hypothetical protein
MKTVKQILSEMKSEGTLKIVLDEVYDIYEGAGEEQDLGLQILEKYADRLPADLQSLIAEDITSLFEADEDEEDDEDEESDEESDEDGEDDEEVDESLQEGLEKAKRLKLAKMRAKVAGTRKRVSTEDGKFAGFHTVDVEASRMGKKIGKKNLKKAHKAGAIRKSLKTKKKLGEID